MQNALLHKMILGLLFVGVASAAEPGNAGSTKRPVVKIVDSRAAAHRTIGNPTADEATVVATVRSSGGLILNGIPTPPGVNSVVVTRGDVVETVGKPAVATLASGQSVSLAASTSYQSQSGSLEKTITNSQNSRVTTFALPPVSVKVR